MEIELVLVEANNSSSKDNKSNDSSKVKESSDKNSSSDSSSKGKDSTGRNAPVQGSRHEPGLQEQRNVVA